MSAPVLPAPPPAPPGASPSPPPAPPSAVRRRTTTAPRTVASALLAVLLLALFNADDLLGRARALPFGWQRSAAVDVTSALHTVSASLLLNRPRLAFDRLFGHERKTTASTAPINGVKVQPFRPTTAHPVRIYIGGDSVAQAFTDGFRSEVAGRGDIATTVEYRFATGLARPDYFDWPGRLRAVLARSSGPHIVVVMFGANDMQPIMTSSGPARVGTTGWLTEYRARVARTMQLLTEAGVDAYWVGQPPMRASTFDRRIDQVDDIYAAEAALHPGVTFIDSRPLFAGPGGGFTAYLPGTDGQPVLMRASDGVHLSAAGGRRLAAAVLGVIEKRWPLARP